VVVNRVMLWLGGKVTRNEKKIKSKDPGPNPQSYDFEFTATTPAL
jgi:hypothetical protein